MKDHNFLFKLGGIRLTRKLGLGSPGHQNSKKPEIRYRRSIRSRGKNIFATRVKLYF